ncbi:MAG: Asp-tRNA(Asn)/Glu-tRNA(Gln) amidotransferase subunit GatA [Calditrichaeota bacterium]|nr:Asp-tRNA(Asn)/Glu-tRNA(Gln) amidotransferase subunit GatA [Calditrichota bacterium]MCB9366438.1 Asp-tRNA(Asn)/Glu-tRNA(Gln) amidotransferase subunit GatA [Calditrichota bacterium]
MHPRIPSPAILRQTPSKLPEAVEAALACAREHEDLGAYLTLLEERAREQAAQVVARVNAGERLPLAGYLVAVKDNIAIKDVPLTCGSKILDHHPSVFTATAVERLERAGAVIIGKTNLDEFAMGSSTENSALKQTLHPRDISRVPGGSSGGSAVALAIGSCHAALGSETGGSVRQPAAFCGVCGLKPTYGRISRYGLVAFGSSLDQIAPFASTCEELYPVLCAMSGADPRDATSASAPVPSSQKLTEPDRKLRIGVLRDYLEHESLAPDIASASRDAIERLRSDGHELIDLHLPVLSYSIPVYYIVATAEASSNLARFDGVRYGFRHPEADELSQVYDLSRGGGFGPEVRRRIMMGTYVLSAGYYDAYYNTALKVRRVIADALLDALSRVDVILTPTTPSTAFKIGEKVDDPVAMYLSDVFTVPANLAGVPALSVPWSDDSNGLPIGLQLIGKSFEEEFLLRSGMILERLRPTT